MARLPRWLQLERVDYEPRELFEARRVLGVPGWLQIALVAGGFVATALISHAEYRAKGTSFGFAGTGTNAMLCPIYEELLFRGWLLGLLAHRRSPWFAIAVSSFFFGLLHLRNLYWLEPMPLARMMVHAGLVVGPLFGWVTLRTRSVWPAVILHYLNNLASWFARA